jgi:hypothetical protein
MSLARQPLPARCGMGRRGNQLLDLLRGGGVGRTVPVRQHRQRGPASRWRKSTPTAGTPTYPEWAPASATATGSTGRGISNTAIAPTPPSCSSTPTPRRSTATSTGTPRASPTFPTTSTQRNDTDSGPHIPKSVVANPFFDWEGDRHPDTSMDDTVIYELHVKGFTALHPDIPESQRGTYSGLGHPASVEYLQNLGITAVELLPSTTSSTITIWSTGGCATTGATTRSATSPPTRTTPPPGPGASRSMSSRGWSRPSTPPASR